MVGEVEDKEVVEKEAEVEEEEVGV